jgi:non-ribosomal peptide synthetase component F
MMQAVLGLVLGVMAGRDDVLFGSPVSGRHSEIDGMEEQVGLFLNTIPVRTRLDTAQALWDQLPALQQRHIALMEHDGLGLAAIQRAAGAAALFDTLLVVENYPDNAYLAQELPGRDGQPLRIGDVVNRGYSHYPLALLVLPGERLTLLVENRGAVADVAALAQRVAQVLRTALEQPQLPLSRYAWLPPTTQRWHCRRRRCATPWPTRPAAHRTVPRWPTRRCSWITPIRGARYAYWPPGWRSRASRRETSWR